jgi:hypothetical protein
MVYTSRYYNIVVSRQLDYLKIIGSSTLPFQMDTLATFVHNHPFAWFNNPILSLWKGAPCPWTKAACSRLFTNYSTHELTIGRGVQRFIHARKQSMHQPNPTLAQTLSLLHTSIHFNNQQSLSPSLGAPVVFIPQINHIKIERTRRNIGWTVAKGPRIIPCLSLFFSISRYNIYPWGYIHAQPGVQDTNI